MFELFFKLMFAHFFADITLQSEKLSKGKNRNKKSDYIPPGQKYVACWPYDLTAHAITHGGFVYIATGNVLLGIIETVLHWVIDFAKCENWTNPHTDQLLHFMCKIGYILYCVNAGII